MNMRLHYATITSRLEKQYRTLYEQQRKSRSGINNSAKLRELQEQIDFNTKEMLKHPV